MNYSLCPKCKGVLEDDGTCSCGYNIKPRRGEVRAINRNCPWNDHGNICGVVGSMSESTNGEGPWYCSDHFWRLKGYAKKTGSRHVSYRERWYQERKLPYEPAKLENDGNMRRVTDSLGSVG